MKANRHSIDHYLIYIGSKKMAQLIIEKGANVNAVDDDQNSALIYAADRGIFFDIIHSFIGFHSKKNKLTISTLCAQGIGILLSC